MTVINTDLDLNQHMLTYLGTRWTETGDKSQAIKTAFPTWVVSRQNSLSEDMTNRLTGFTVLTTVSNPAVFRTFIVANLPSDDESARDYTLRYVYDRLEHDQLVDDGAFQATVAAVTIVTSTTVMAAWGTWWATVTEDVPTEFEDALAAFKQHLAATSRAVTGQAVRTLAAETDFDFAFNTWVAQQLTNIGQGNPADRFLPKIQEGAACWNWALSACETTTVNPADVMSWLHAPLPVDGADESMPESVADVVTAGAKLDAKNDLIAVKAAMHEDGLALMGENYDENWPTDPDKPGRVRSLSRRTFSALLTLNGFTVGGTSGYSVGIEYQPGQGVSWEHWWVESGQTIVETFPTLKYVINATNQRQTDRMGEEQAALYEVVILAVQDLLPRHHAVIRAGMAQYL